MRGRLVAVGLFALLLTGCGTPALSTSDSPSPVSSPSATPGTPQEDGRFGLDDTAQFPNGIEVSTPGTEVRRATTSQRGAASTGGQIVVVSILISNGTKTTYDPRSALIGATYGREDTPATMITDSTADLLTGFDAPIASGDEATVPIGFAVPDAGLSRVTVTVDLADDVNAPISFTGPIKK